MSNAVFSNNRLLTQGLDKDKNGIMNELLIKNHMKPEVDNNRDGKVSRTELESALSTNKVEISNGQVTHNRGTKIFTNGLETLRNINHISDNAIDHSWKYSYHNLEGQERVRQLNANNYEYASQIREMENSLRSIRNMTSSMGDTTSRNINNIASNAISNSNFTMMLESVNTIVDIVGGGSSIYDDPFSGGSIHDDPFSDGKSGYVDTTDLERRNMNLRTAYNTLNSALKNINNMTDNLPDVNKILRKTDNTISGAYSDIQKIQNSNKEPEQVRSRLNDLADQSAAQVADRGKTYGLIGAGVGLVGGGIAGYFMGGNAIKGAAIGAGFGTAAVGGISALIGNSIDKGHERKANELKELGNDVVNYNPQAETEKLEDATVQTYNEMIIARDNHDLDNARVSSNNLNSIYGKVNNVSNNASRIWGAYNK